MKVLKMRIKKLILLSVLMVIIFSTFSCFGWSPKNQEKAREIFGLPEFPNMSLTSNLFPVYLVSTAEEFNNIRKYKDRSFLIMNDIDMSSIENFEPIGTKEEPFRGEISSSCIYTYGQIEFLKDIGICNNTGTKTISNITIKINDDNFHEYVGVIGYTDESNINYFLNGINEMAGIERKNNDTRGFVN